MLDSYGNWYPRLSPKQVEVYNDPRQHILCNGPRLCGKSIVAVHKVIKHAWMFDNDRVGIFVKSTKVGKSGIWDDLITYALPEWVEGLGDIGFKITVGPAVDGSTRMHYIRIANRHGGESEIQLHSLHHQESVAEKMKGSRFGALCFDEVDVYDSEEVFNVSTLQLRQIGLPEDKHLWLGTCNPAGDNDHWLYRKFWVDPHNPEIDEEYRKTLGLYEFKLADNPFLDPKSIAKLRANYATDPEQYQRYVEGLWVPDQRTVHFAGAYRDSFHKVGNPATGETIVPTKDCHEIVVGWDIGDRNHAVVFAEHVVTATNDYWALLDEVVHIGEDISIEELVFEVKEKMAALKALVPENKLTFRHWSDRSAFDRYRSAADAKDHILVNRYSEGDITLIGCPKPPNSVQARLALMRQLLVGEKVFVSWHCERLVTMFKKLAKGKTKGEQIKRDANIHVFDSATYLLYGELIDSIEANMRPKIDNRDLSVTSIAA